jgi:phage terminase Nu1 subunit (DNA packaging protein)
LKAPSIKGYPLEISQRYLALAVGKSQKTIQNWTDAGAPRNGNKTYSAPAVYAWRLEREYSKGLSDGAKIASEGDDPDNDWDQRKKRAQALIAELHLEEKIGRLSNLDQVKTAWTRALSILRSTLQAIPKTMAAKVAGMSREEVFEALDKAIRDAVDHVIDAYEQEESKLNSKKSDTADDLKKITT